MPKPTWIVNGTRWVRGLIGRDVPQAPWPGDEQLVLGGDAVRTLEERLCDTVVSATDPTVVAGLGGLAMAGRRAAGFTSGAALAAAGDVLQEAASRRAPFVLHAATATPEDHEGLQAVADSGVLVAQARDLQHLLDLTLVARRVAELGLVPVVVAMDVRGADASLGTVHLPAVELLSQYLGSPDDTIESPTPAQQLLFGDHRRRLPRWFDPDRPVGHGFVPDADHTATVMAGRSVFFGEALGPLVRASLQGLTELTGRPSSPVDVHRPKRARNVLVTQGALFDLARGVADHLRRHEKLDVGVATVDWMRPFPEDEVRHALEGVRAATVLEAIADPPGAEPPLLQAVRAALGSDAPQLRHASWTPGAPVAAGDLAHLFRRMADEGDFTRPIHLGVREPVGETAFPKRQVLLQTLSRAFPDMGGMGSEEGRPIDLRPKGARTVGLFIHGDEPRRALLDLGGALEGTVGATLAGRVHGLGHGEIEARITVADEPFSDPGDELPLDLALASEAVIPAGIRPLQQVIDGGTVVIGTSRSAEELWSTLPSIWRDTIRSRGLSLRTTPDDPVALVGAAARLLGDQDEAATAGVPDVTEVPWRELPDPETREGGAHAPMAARRFARGDAAYDSVPRAWGELVEPMRAGEEVARVPDPRSALGAVPPSTAGLFDVGQGHAVVPQIDLDACVGCGRCWSTCPDTAIAPAALSTETMLDAASERASTGERDPAAAKLQRAHRQLATRIDGLLSKSGHTSLHEEALREAYAWLVDKMKVGDDERASMDAAFDATVSELSRIGAAATEHLFHDAHRQEKGAGSLLVLAVDPQSCQGCGVCAQECPTDAIAMVPRTPARVASRAAELRVWETLPDTTGPTIARASDNPEVGGLAAVLLSRHCLMSVIGGDGAEPGSGQRVAARQVMAVVEHTMQRRFAAHLSYVDELAGRLRDAIRRGVSEAVPLEDMGNLDRALQHVPDRPSNASMLLSRLEELGERDRVDVRRLRRLLHASREVERIRWELGEGERGMGRSRFGLVLAGKTVAEWAARYPRNPFGVPVTVDTSGGGAALASGIALGLLGRRTEEARVLRWAELLLEAPADLPARQEEIATLGWHDLSDEEIALCPPVLLLATPDAFEAHGSTGIEHLLAGRLPVKALMLDPHDLDAPGLNPSVMAMIHRKAFVLGTSIAHQQHLFAGTTGALGFAGPALIHVHTPSPRRHGFDPAKAIERAQRAVLARVHPLLRYDPRREGVFGSRIDLDHNPAPDRTWASDDDGEVKPTHWAAGERRFAMPGTAEALPAWESERAEVWTMLQELAGVVTPFTQSVRDAIEGEVGETHAAEVAALKAEHERQLAELRQAQTADQASRLRERLLQLTGYARQEGDSPPDGGTS